MRQYGFIGQILSNVVLSFWTALGLFPLYWMLVLAFQPNQATLKLPPNWFPSPFSLGNLRMLFRESMLARWTLNSLAVAVVVTSGQLFLCSLAGYVFAKLRFAGREALFSALLAIMLIPGQLTLIPLYMICVWLGFVNALPGVIVPALMSPFGAFMLRQFFRTIPTEIIESAQIDGCGAFSTYWRILLPLARPGLAVLAIFTFIGTWNEFMWPLIILGKERLFTIQLGLAEIYLRNGRAIPGLAMASALFAALPCIVLFFAFQRYFMEGLTLGALKG